MTTSRLVRYRLHFALLGLLVLGWFTLAVRPVSAAPTDAVSTPPTGSLGTTFTLKAGGFLAGETVDLWTTDPKGVALGANYILADSSGNIEVRVETTDPSGLAAAAGGNYTQFITVYDTDGNLTEQYLRVVLYAPSIGNWYLTGSGSTSSYSKIFNFNILAGSPSSEIIASTPQTGNIGTSFVMQSGGFKSGETVDLWTTDPKGQALDAKFLLADDTGNVKVIVESSDPDGLLAGDGTNATKYVVVYDTDGNITDRYLQVVLAKPSSGTWFVTSRGSTTGTSRIFTFGIN